MKKIVRLLAITAIFQTGLAYIPQNGPLTLGDEFQTNQLTFARSTKRGLIMNTIITNPEFTAELTTVHNFLNISRANTHGLPSYEEIVDALQISTNNNGAIAVIEAFEKAIMRYLHYNHYICSIEGKNINIFFTGIKYNWFYPSEWINPTSWLSSNNSAEIRQLIDELEQLSIIASKHSIITSKRLQIKINAYRSWKQNSIAFITILSTIGAGLYIKNKSR